MLRCIVLCLALSTASPGQSPAPIREWLDSWQPSKAVPGAQRLLEETRGARPADYAAALELYAESLSLAGDPAALVKLQEGLRAWEQVADAGPVPAARLHTLLGSEYNLRYEVANAIREFESALSGLLSASSGNVEADRIHAVAAVGLATALTRLNQTTPADAVLQQVRLDRLPRALKNEVRRAQSNAAFRRNDWKLAESLLPEIKGDALEDSKTRYGLAGIYLERGDYARADVAYQDVLREWGSRLGSGNRRLIPLLRNLGRLYRFQGRYAESVDVLTNALNISDKAHGTDSPLSAEITGVLAATKAEGGQFAEALALYQRSIDDARRRAPPAGTEPLAAELFSLSNLEQVMGLFDDSVRHAEESLHMRERLEGPQSAHTVSIYSLLGHVSGLRGDMKRALEYGALAVEIGRRTSGENHPRTTYALADFGEAQFRARDYQGALNSIRKARDGQARLFGEDHVRTAQSTLNLGLAERACGHHAEALAAFTKAAEIWRKTFGPDYPLLAEPLAGIAASLLDTGHAAEAIEPALESARVRRLSLTDVAMNGAERDSLIYARMDRPGLGLALDALAAVRPEGGVLRRVWDSVALDRAAVVDAFAERARWARAGGKAAELWQQVARARKALAQAAFVADPRLYATRVLSLREDLDRAERALGEHSSAFLSSRSAQPETINAIRARMNRDCDLVAFARGHSNYVAFVWPAGSAEPRVVPLASVARIDALVNGWRKEMQREQSSFGRNARVNEQAYRRAASALRRAVWDPLEAALRPGHRTQIMLIPDGSLNLINFAALPVGEHSYLAETAPLLITLASERDAVAAVTAAGGIAGKRLFAAGNPARGGGRHAAALWNCLSDRQSFGVDALPSAASEIRSVAGLWRSAGGRVEMATGAAATESALRRQTPGIQIIHVAAHGFFLPVGCQGRLESALADSPLLRSGLILAPESQEEDGILTAAEIATLDWQHAELVILSGCDTGLGLTDAPGEGVLGLRRAVRAAGARALVSSLWPVEDSAASAWMRAFYRVLTHNANPAEAVRAASLDALRARARAGLSTHPFHWAAFLSTGM